MNSLASFKVNPNKRYKNLIFCWVILLLAFLLSFIPSANQLLTNIAYEGDWLYYRIIRAICNMIVMRYPLYLVAGILFLCTCWVICIDFVKYPNEILCTDDSLLIKGKNSEKTINYTDVLIKEHQHYIELGTKKDWILKQISIENKEEFISLLQERGVSLEK